MKGYKAAKMSAVAIAIALAIGCSSDTEDKASDGSDKVEAIAQDNTPEPEAEQEVKSEKPATHHVVSFEELGPSESRDDYRTVYRQHDFVEIFQGLADWNPDLINADISGLASDKYSYLSDLYRDFDREQDVFVKAEKKQAFEVAQQEIRDNPTNKNRLVTYIAGMGSNFKPYDIETKSFKIVFPAVNEADKLDFYMKGAPHPRVGPDPSKLYGVTNSITSVEHIVTDIDEARNLEAKRVAGTYAHVYGEINTLTEDLKSSSRREIKITPHLIEIFDKEDNLVLSQTF